MVQPYSNTDAATTWQNNRFVLSERSAVHMVYTLSIAANILPMRMLISFSGDVILLPRYMNWSTNFRGLPFNEDIAASGLKQCFMSSRRDQCFLLPALGYAAEI